MLPVALVPVLRHAEAQGVALLGLLRADVAGHDDDGVAEVHLVPLSVGQPPVVQDLEQDVVDLRVRLLDLVKEDDGVGPAAHLIRQLAAAVVPHIAGGRAQELRDLVLLHELAHVNADHRVLTAEEEAGQAPRQLRLAHARGAHEQEAADGPPGVPQARARTAYGPGNGADRLVLADEAGGDLLLHAQQALRLRLGELLDRHAGLFRHHRGDLLRRDPALLRGAPLAPFLHGGVEAVGQGVLLVPQVRGALVLLAHHGLLLLAHHVLQLLLHG